MYQVVEVRIREAGRIAYFLIGDIDAKPGEYCIIEADRGLDYGQVMSDKDMLEVLNGDGPIRKILRKATEEDLSRIERNRQEAIHAISICKEKIETHKLDMKLVDGEYSFDRSKLIFYFTSEGRIDFRDLVKDLAGIFRTRIELRQIGVRDEAKLFGGYGPCGRQLCCALFLKNFTNIAIKMAKEQNIPLNPSKISGVCGRLMCCLSYEHEIYKERECSHECLR